MSATTPIVGLEPQDPTTVENNKKIIAASTVVRDPKTHIPVLQAPIGPQGINESIYVVYDKSGDPHLFYNQSSVVGNKTVVSNGRQEAAKATLNLMEASGLSTDTIWQKLYKEGFATKQQSQDKIGKELVGVLGGFTSYAGAHQSNIPVGQKPLTADIWAPPGGTISKAVGGQDKTTYTDSSYTTNSTNTASVSSDNKTKNHDVNSNVTNTNESNTYLTTPTDANNELDLFYQEQLGRSATPEEHAAYLTQLNKEETIGAATVKVNGKTTTVTDQLGDTKTQTNKDVSKTSGHVTDHVASTIHDGAASASVNESHVTNANSSSVESSTGTSTGNTKSKSSTTGDINRVTTGNGLQPSDHTRIQSGILLNTLHGMTPDQIGSTNGKIAQQTQNLKQYANLYGVDYGTPSIIGDLTQNLANNGALINPNLDAQKLKIQALAKNKYSNIAGLIDAGVTPNDVKNQYAQMYGNTLEVNPNTINIQDPLIQQAISNGGTDANGKPINGNATMNMDDFQRLLRNDSRWGHTQNAREEGSSYVNTILQNFGLVG